jgi:hypothetical protein
MNAAELTRNALTGDRGVCNEREAFARAFINDAQDAEAPPVGHLVVDEIKRPTGVRPIQRLHRRAKAQSPFAPAAFSHHPSAPFSLGRAAPSQCGAVGFSST